MYNNFQHQQKNEKSHATDSHQTAYMMLLQANRN